MERKLNGKWSKIICVKLCGMKIRRNRDGMENFTTRYVEWRKSRSER